MFMHWLWFWFGVGFGFCFEDFLIFKMDWTLWFKETSKCDFCLWGTGPPISVVITEMLVMSQQETLEVFVSFWQNLEWHFHLSSSALCLPKALLAKVLVTDCKQNSVHYLAFMKWVISWMEYLQSLLEFLHFGEIRYFNCSLEAQMDL